MRSFFSVVIGLTAASRTASVGGGALVARSAYAAWMSSLDAGHRTLIGVRAFTVVSILLALLGASACGLVEPKTEVQYQPLYLPIEISIDNSGEVSVTRSLSRITPIGRFEVTAGAKRELEGSGTVLVIRHEVGGKTVEDGFELPDKSAFSLCLDGEFREEIRQDGKRTYVTVTAGDEVRDIRLVEPDRPEACQSNPTVPAGRIPGPESDAPIGVVRAYTQELASSVDSAPARALECTSPQLQEFRARIADVARREQFFETQISVAVENFRESLDGDHASVTADLRLTAHASTGDQVLTMSYRYGLTRETSWKVCNAQRVS